MDFGLVGPWTYGVDRFRTAAYSSHVNEIGNGDCNASNPLLIPLLRAAQKVEARVEAALGETGLTLAKLGVLNNLVQSNEPLPLGRLAERICCVKSNMTQLVDRLEAEGLVARVADPQDRRSIRAAITEEGRRRHAAGSKIVAEHEQMILAGFGNDERSELESLIGHIGT